MDNHRRVSRFDMPWPSAEPRNRGGPWPSDSRSSGDWRSSQERQRSPDYFQGSSRSPRRSRSPAGFDPVRRMRSRSPMMAPLSPPRKDFGPRSRSPSRRSFSPQQHRGYSFEERSIWDHNPMTVLDGTVKELIDEFTGVMSVEVNGEHFTAFFHATALWLTNPEGNPYGPPVKFTDILGKNTATTKENKNVTLANEAGTGCEFLLHAMPVKSDIVQFVVLSAWPKSTEPPMLPSDENARKILEKKQEYFLKEFHNKLEASQAVEATFPGCLPSLYPDVVATIWEIRDDHFGIIEIKGRDPINFRFFALFHKDDVWLRDGKRSVAVDFFKHKPLAEMCKVGQPVNIIARSILASKGANISPAVLELQAVVVSLHPDQIPSGASKPTWLAQGPGVFGNANRSCQFLSKKLYEELNAKLKNFLHTSGKKLPHLDPKLVEGPAPVMPMMMSAVQIKRERYEEPQPGPSSSLSAVSEKLPQKLHDVHARVTHHLGQDLAIVDAVNGNWKCLVFLSKSIRPSTLVVDLKVLFPLHSEVMIKATMMDPKRPIQYIANLVWNPVEFPPQQVAHLYNDISGVDIAKYNDVNNTVGRVMDTVSKLPISRGGIAATGIVVDTHVAKAGIVDRILDDNFGLLRIDKGLVLFDTCDFWLSTQTTAAKLNKTLAECVKVGDKVLTHACLIDKSAKVAFLATCVWLEMNSAFVNPLNRPLPIARKDIHQQKIDIYHNVVLSIAATLPTPESIAQAQLPADDDGLDTGDLVLWQKATVKAVFFDSSWKKNGGLVGGIVQVTGLSGYAFFMSKNFVKVDSVPCIGMEEYVNLYPTRKLKNAPRLGGFAYICTSLYPVFMTRESCGLVSVHTLRPVLKESSEMLERILQNVPMPNIDNYIRTKPCVINVDGPNSQAKQLAPLIDVGSAHLRCMIDDVSGVLVCANDPKPCYFEIEDLNVGLPVSYMDAVMLLNRMQGVKVQFQARLMDEKAAIPYVTHLKGVQLSGHIPSFMAHVKVHRADKSKFPSGLNSDKVHRYKKANELFAKGQFRSISDILSKTSSCSKDHVAATGVVKNILNENFGLIACGEDFALFDTYDLYVADQKTAADGGKTVGDCFKVGQSVVFNACFVSGDLPLTHLATSVWAKGNAKVVKPEGPLTKDQIQPDKLKIFEQVSKSCEQIIKSYKQSSSDRKAMIDKVYQSDKYKVYKENVGLEARRSKDPKTPDLNESLSAREWLDRMNAWKSSISLWHRNFEDASSLLITDTSIKDYQSAATVDKFLNDKFAVLVLPSGKKAFVHQDRVWIFKQKMFGGWKPLTFPSYKVINVNARAIKPVRDVQYQVTFAHTGLFTRDYKTKMFTYPDNMKAWIKEIVTLDTLNRELKEFQVAYE